MLIRFVLFGGARKAGRFVLDWRVVLTVVPAMLVHPGWDTSPSVPASWAWDKALAGIVFVGMVVFTIRPMKRIIRKTREAVEETRESPERSIGAR